MNWTEITPLRYLFLIGVLGSLMGCGSTAPRYASAYADCGSALDEADDSNTSVSPPSTINTTAMMRVISEYLGVPYRFAGESEDGIDCSALTRVVFAKAFMITLPRSTEEQYHAGKKIQFKHLAPGDLVFFNTTGYNPSHVGIYIGDGLFVHASVDEGVTLSSLSTPYYCRKYSGARRVIP